MATATISITAKSPKKDLVEYLRSLLGEIKSENLKSRVNYTLKSFGEDEKSVSKSDVYGLIREIIEPKKDKKAPVENQPKPALKSKKAEKPAKASDEDESKEEAPAPKAKKPLKKDKAPKKPEAKVETTDDLVKGSRPLARLFPATIEHEALGTLKACYDKYLDWNSIREALNNGTELIFAAYWTKRHLKEYGYAHMTGCPVPKSGFPDDLDMLQALYACENVERVYVISAYTEAVFAFNGEDIVPVECETNDGEKYNVRYSNGMEFEIYEVVKSEGETK